MVAIAAFASLTFSANGQYYFNNLVDIGGAFPSTPEGFAGFIVDESANTISVLSSLSSDNKPYIFTCDLLGDSLNTVSIENDHAPSYYEPGLQNQFMLDYDGNRIISGYMKHSIDDSDGYVVKLNEAGDTVWTLMLGGAYKDPFGSMTLCPADSGYVFTGGNMSLNGGSHQDMWIVKTDTGGNVLWQNNFGGTGTEYGYAIDTTDDGGYIMAGLTSTYGAGLWDIYVVRVDDVGNMIWQKWFGLENNEAGFVKTLPNGNFLVYGAYRFENPSSPGSLANHGMAMELDQDGNQLWINYYSNTDSASWEYYVYKEWFTNVVIVSDGYVFCGASKDTVDNNPLGWLVKTDFSGNQLWSRRFRKRDNDNYLSAIGELSGGDLLLTGYVFPEVPAPEQTQDSWIIRTNCLGFDDYPEAAGIFQNAEDNTIILQNQSQRFGDGIVYWGDGESDTFTEFDDTLISHTYASEGTYSAMLVVNACYHSDTLVWNVEATVTEIVENEINTFLMYPNPTSQVVTIRPNEPLKGETQLAVLDIQGRQLMLRSVQDNEKIVLDVSDFPKGTYVIRLTTSNGSMTKKLIVQ